MIRRWFTRNSIPDTPDMDLSDGHGNWWTRCHLDDCDLHITRPGDANCHREFCYGSLRATTTAENKNDITLPKEQK